MLDLKALLAKILNCLTCDLLYNGSFTSGTLTLTNAIANYKSLIFVYTDNDGVLHTQQVITNNASNGTFTLDVVRVTGAPYLKNMILNINGNVLTAQFNRQWASNTPTTGNYVIINKVYGCKGIVSNGGGYLTSKFYEIFSHLERWWEYVRLKGVVGENIKHLSRIGDSKNLYCFWESLQHILRNNFNRRNTNRIYANSDFKGCDKSGRLALLSMASSREHSNHRCIARDFKWDDIFTLNYNRRSIYQNKLNILNLERGCLAC